MENLAPLAETFTQAVVIPVLAELEALPATLRSLAANPAAERASTLVALVVNHSSATPPEAAAENRELLIRLRRGDFSGLGLQLAWLELEVTPAGGVGEARKAGLDACLPLLDNAPDPLLFCLDADTLVEPDYLAAVRREFAGHPEWRGAALAFRHAEPADPRLAAAIRSYEAYLESYTAGLRYAGSPYAYGVMGSAMVCRRDAYVAAGGMRRRAGGEDFYFLQALRKTGPVGSITATVVHPAARLSRRVPFGTGPRLSEIVAGTAAEPYPREPFERLKFLLAAAAEASPEEFALRLPETSPEAAAFLAEQGFASAWVKILKNTPGDDDHRREAFHRWFDAFRTLKFIHAMIYC